MLLILQGVSIARNKLKHELMIIRMDKVENFNC